MEEIEIYLQEAKDKQWTIDVVSLSEQFNISVEQVQEHVNRVYGQS